MNEDQIFDIEFECEGKSYNGWVNPIEKLHADDLPAFFHVMPDNVSFGYLSGSNGTLTTDDQRPAALVEAAGKQIQQRYKLIN